MIFAAKLQFLVDFPCESHISPLRSGLYIYIYILVGGFNHLEKYESQWQGWHPIYEMENKKCLKPPTSIYIYIIDISPHLWYISQFLEVNIPQFYIWIITQELWLLCPDGPAFARCFDRTPLAGQCPTTATPNLAVPSPNNLDDWLVLGGSSHLVSGL